MASLWCDGHLIDAACWSSGPCSWRGHSHICAEVRRLSWCEAFRNRPRPLLNGVYISRVSYVRQGEQSLDSYYAPYHLCVYHRYLRLFPDGSAVSATLADSPESVRRC